MTDIRQAAALHQGGKLAEAEAAYLSILKADPRHFDANHLLGVVYVQRGQHEMGATQIRCALNINPASAPALSNLGNALSGMKQPAEALISYDRALALDPRLADAHFNRGNALKDLGRKDEAVDSYARAIALSPARADFIMMRVRTLTTMGRREEALEGLMAAAKLKPNDADTAVMQGNLLIDLGRAGDALAAYDRALALKPDYAEVMLNRGNALRALGRNDDALQSYTRALALKPDFADACINKAQLLLSLGKAAEAEADFRQAITLDPARSVALHGYANIHYGRGEVKEALALYKRASEADPAAHGALYMLADCYFQQGDLTSAFHYLIRAIAAAPEETKYKENFIIYAEGANPSAFDPALAGTLLQCLETPGLDCSRASALWHNLLVLDPAFRADLPAPFFLRGLEKICVYNLEFETALTRLRRALLLEPQNFKPDARLQLAAALAQYCFNTEYIFDVTAEETAALAALKDETAVTIAVRACYAQLPPATAQKDPALAGIIRTQVEEPKAIAALRATIPALTPISAGVSAAVRGQYEESPYPKWKSVPKHLRLDPVADALTKPGTKILIAGCGTGQEAAEMATALPQASVLAVDLSLSSLSYAKYTTQKAGIGNIAFKHADILQLGGIPDRFDGIGSGGVLHHLENPLQGWRIITGLLKDGGLMRIALYSTAARKHITLAREAARKGGFAPTPEGMRAFRRESKKLLPPETFAALSGASDYFYMPMYRDMLFHVQEHCFDLPQIETALAGLGLEFVKLLPPPQAVTHYKTMFGDDPMQGSLQNWHRVEQKYPDTFIAMYQFWCRKSARQV
ncbi:MAG: tetratricopeptide repeat protein [Alphaproteobacteria bacterium]